MNSATISTARPINQRTVAALNVALINEVLQCSVGGLHDVTPRITAEWVSPGVVRVMVTEEKLLPFGLIFARGFLAGRKA